MNPCGAAASKTKLSKDWEGKAGCKGGWGEWQGDGSIDVKKCPA